MAIDYAFVCVTCDATPEGDSQDMDTHVKEDWPDEQIVLYCVQCGGEQFYVGVGEYDPNEGEEL